MFISVSHSKTIVASALLMLASAVSAADREIDGVVQAINISDKSVSVLSEESGKVLTYSFVDTPKVDVGGRKYRNLSVLEVGQNVTLRFKQEETAEKPLSVLKGEIRKIDADQGAALIYPENGRRARLVTLPRSVAVSGLRKGAGVQDLKEGHLVTLKYSVR